MLNSIREGYKNISSTKKDELFTDEVRIKTGSDKFSVIEWGTRFHYSDSTEIEFRTSPQPSFNKNFDLLSQDLNKHLNEGYKNVIFTDSARQGERLYAIFQDLPVLPSSPSPREGAPFPAGKAGVMVPFSAQMLSVHEGFVDHDLKLVCYTDHQIFNRYHRYRLREKFSKDRALTIKELTGLKPGDFVTHIDHGIGKFAGLEKIEVNGKPQEALRLMYRDNDILYVSIHSLHRISKYSGKDGAIPSLNKLGSATWQNLKQKTKSRVKDIAKDLIALYAKRKAANGFSFSPDTYLQNELEASFIYEDTPDQVKATRDVKKDLEKSYPMDRLICGDVGFGKTEVAIRAAFKAVTDGKQVAVLVPTTILALQHYNTFKERLKDFPCNIDYINRFKSQKQQSETIQKLVDGKIDIIIGTHRLLGKEIKFKDLGLLVVDEEQKFGVAAKEKLKALRVNVDTLTLTATPIPRTLQFSLMGARDLSIINTPPPNRYPITTEVHTFSEALIREAINYEVSRGGQVFFIHNRVKDILGVVTMIQKLCPKIKIAAGHGQMDGDKLEETMLGFIEGEYDVLVSTTIVESGLDIPNANTMIINHAENFGLSDLHQLRGRVGRSNKKAFCYLLAPPLSVLTPEARQRLKALEEFSELGSGFNISLRDLDIRGAGNLLGGEQSGFISDIGFEMYHKILDEAMQELKESDFKSLFESERSKDGEGRKGEKNNGLHSDKSSLPFLKECQIDTDLEILIPDNYVNSISERLNLYKTINDIEDESGLSDFEKNITDRFGPVPLPVQELINTIRLRWKARELGFEKIILRNSKFTCHFIRDEKAPYFQSEIFTNILGFVQSHHKICRMREEKGKLTLVFNDVPGVEKANEFLKRVEKRDMGIEI
jgi:transcription-repair coupling factor (superfamily II helicase)